MTADERCDETPGVPRVRPGPIVWMSRAMRDSIERAVSEYRGETWRIDDEKDFSEFACHRCAIVSDSVYAVFFKFAEEPEARKQFEVEMSGLRTLHEKSGVLIPRPIDVVPTESGTLLIMEALQAVDRGSRHWREIGATLARIHQVRGEYFGFETDGFCGPIPQDNTPASDWVTFYRERLLLPRLQLAIRSGNMPSRVIHRVETVIGRLSELCDAEMTPVLLHGDAQQNNFISTADGTFVIDPSVYYGNPEMDLALIDAFQPMPDDVLAGYRETVPIDPAFPDRRDLWRVPLYLAAVAIEGSAYLSRLTDALRKYV